MSGNGNLATRVDIENLQAQIRQLQVKTTRTVALVNGVPVAAAKRFRIATKTLGLTLAGVTVTFDVVWSSPMPTAVYNVDVACSALLGMPTVTISAQTTAGCTVSFVTPLIATNAVVIVLGVSAA